MNLRPVRSICGRAAHSGDSPPKCYLAPGHTEPHSWDPAWFNCFKLSPQQQEDAQVLALNLSDATDDLNDALRGVEHALREKAYKVASVPLPKGRRLEWNGTILVVISPEMRGPPTSLLSSSSEIRVDAGFALKALGEKLNGQVP